MSTTTPTRGAKGLPRSQKVFVATGLGPILIAFAVLSLLPIGIAIWLSFFKYDGLSHNVPFIGLENYVNAFSDGRFASDLGHSVLYALVGVPLNICISLPVAVGLSKVPRFQSILRTAYFAPIAVSAVAVAVLWIPMFAPQGWINTGLDLIGVAGPSWLADPSTSLWSVLVAGVWQDLPYNIIVFMAGLTTIPGYLYEASELDGATSRRQFRSITLPLLVPTMVFASILTFTSYMQQFTQVQVMTNGGPVRSSETLVLYIYNLSFNSHQMGYASALSVLLMIFMLLVAAFQMWLGRTRWEY